LENVVDGPETEGDFILEALDNFLTIVGVDWTLSFIVVWTEGDISQSTDSSVCVDADRRNELL
jgi:hypothetical protein